MMLDPQNKTFDEIDISTRLDDILKDAPILPMIPRTDSQDPSSPNNNNGASRLVSAPYDEQENLSAPMSPATPQATVSPVSPCCSMEYPTSTYTSITGKLTNIEDTYQIDPQILGSGHHGSVRKCIHRQTGELCAVKSISKNDKVVKTGNLVREVLLLEEMSAHDNSIRLVDVIEDEEYLHIVTELCRGGELFDRIVEKASSCSGGRNGGSGGGCFSEYQAANILHQLLQVVSHMHAHNIVHRDIKPENILFTSKDEDAPIKLIDYGLARKHYQTKGEPNMKTIVGTPYYISPDVLSKSYTKACDLWSIGVIAYILLCGYPPFNGRNNKEVYESVRRGIYWFPSDDWKNVSDAARDFIARLLQKDPRQRMSVEQALRHPWIVSHLKSRSGRDEREDSVEVVFEEESRKDSIICGNGNSLLGVEPMVLGAELV